MAGLSIVLLESNYDSATLYQNSKEDNMNKKSVSRVDHEAGENFEQIKNEVPDNKLQTTQQIADTESAIKTEVPKSSFQATKGKVKGATLKQEAIAEMIGGSANSAGMGISAAGRSVSGTVGGILGANNSTPIAGKSRSDSRVGKKLDRTATKLNFTPSEQVIVAVDESKPLADASGEDQGYNGTYRNESARSQKVMGAVPGDLMFQRSADLITKDKLYFVEGQQVFQVDSDRTDLNPSESCFNENDASYSHPVTYHSGNFLHRALHFGIDDQGKVDYFYADVEDLTPNIAVDPEIANVSSAHRLIKSNVAEIDRQIMDSKAGDEKADIWSPLGRAVKEPTKNAYLLSSLEADTGAYSHLAYSKASTNMAFQLNRGPKDGLNEIGPAIEECVGWRESAGDSITISESYSNALSNVFSSSNYDKGDPTIMIDAYDSKAKYKNKADLLLQPRGFRMHLQTADNNINPLKIPTEYANVFAGQEVFSTIDHEYDPIMPICMTDKANLITVHNFNELCAFMTYKDLIKVKYSSTNIESTYTYNTIKIIRKGLMSKVNLSKLYVLYKKTDGDGLVYNSNTGVISWDPDSSNLTDCEIEVIVSRESAVTGYTLLATVSDTDTFDVVINIPKVQENNDTGTVTACTYTARTSDKVYDQLAGPYSYSYSDLRNNYIVDVKHPLIDGIIEYINNAIGMKFKQLLGSKSELFVPMVFSTQHMTLAQLLICAAMPWITRVRANSMKDIIYYEDNIHEYPFSKLDSIKNVPFHNYKNFSFEGYDEPLQTKVMDPATAIQWVMPEFFWKVGSSKYVLPWYFNENEFTVVSEGKIQLDASAMSFPSIRSGIRYGALDTFYGMTEKDVRLSLDRMTKFIMLKNTISTIKSYKYGRNTDGQPYVELSDNDVFTIKDYLECPRELGLCMDAPYGLFTFANDDNNVNTPYALSNEVTPSFEIKIWVNPNTKVNPSILSSEGINISRAANYVQKWLKLSSSTANSDTVIAGLVFGMNDEGAATYKPFAAMATGSQYESGPDIISLQRSLWTRIQLLPFVISPFDGHATSGSGVRDIYDIAYMFGLCGFRASDYRESVYNREKEVVNQGLLFINDPWINDSPIIRAAASSTGLSVTKGYEVKRN